VFKIFIVTVILVISYIPDKVIADTSGDGHTHVLADLETYLTTPVRWDKNDWTQFALITGGIYIASETLDDRWKDEMVNEDHPYYYRGIDKIGDAWGDGRLSGSFLLGVYGYGYWTKDIRFINASRDMLQSAAYTAITTQILKRIFTRDRPNAADDEAGWFGSGVSFPSGHTSNAFAISQSFLNSLDKPGIGMKILFYGLATSTAMARTYDNAHWASDTIAGALVGIYTANFVTRLNKKHEDKYTITPCIGNRIVGLNINW